MTVTICMPKELAEKVKALSEQEHRSFSKQVAFFCDKGVRHLERAALNEGKSEGGK